MNRHHSFTSVIWLHDGVWLASPPAADILAAANVYAATQIHLPPLDFTYTPLRTQYEAVFSDTMRGTPPPARDEEFSLGAPRPQLHPPLQEPTARAALVRMMHRSALPRECIIVDD